MNFKSAEIAFQQLSTNQIVIIIITFLSTSLVLMWLAFFVWRFRTRMLAQAGESRHVCPRCKGSLRRVHRKRQDRIVGALLKLRLGRYRCSNRHCSWEGLMSRSHARHPDSTQQNSTDQENEESPAVINSNLETQLYGSYIETGTIPLPDETHPLLEDEPSPEVADSSWVKA